LVEDGGEEEEEDEVMECAGEVGGRPNVLPPTSVDPPLLWDPSEEEEVEEMDHGAQYLVAHQSTSVEWLGVCAVMRTEGAYSRGWCPSLGGAATSTRRRDNLAEGRRGTHTLISKGSPT